MLLPILPYGHPVLRTKGAKVGALNDDLRQLARNMIETMNAARGVGLAAQQVGRALQLTVVDVRGAERPSQLFLGAREADIETAMPLVLINPQIRLDEAREEGEEGCLSFPGLCAPVMRATTVHVTATGLRGGKLQITATGLVARVLQHEIDHLNGVLFIDRMTPEALKPLEAAIRKLERATLATLPRSRRK